MDNTKLRRTIGLFWDNKSHNSIYHLGRCADFAYALKSFLHGGDYYLVGQMPNSDIAWHVVLKYGGTYWDVRGPNTLAEIRERNPIVAFNGDDNTVTKAGAKEEAHIIKLLNQDFVRETIAGLKEAEKKVK